VLWLLLWCLTPLSTTFQLYRGGQNLIGGENLSTRENTTDLSEVTDKLYHIMLYRTFRLSGIRTHNLKGEASCMRGLKSGKLAGSRFKKNNGLLVSNHILILLFYWAFFASIMPEYLPEKWGRQTQLPRLLRLRIY
jgi:hypothetical protein